MYFSKSIIASALLGLAAATTHSGEAISAGLATSSTSAIAASETRSAAPNAAASAAATSGASAGNIATHVIQVGGPNGSITFSPENVKAAPGDLVQFQFHPKNHSVVQSTFDKPCVPIQNVMPNMTTAFFSGFMPTNASVGATSQVLTYTIRVMDTKPIWFYCSQAKHCQGGMVGAINAAETGNKTMSAFKALAASATENLSPGQAPGSGTQSGSGTGTNNGGGAAQSSSAAGGAGGAGAGAGTGATSTDSSAPAQQTTNAASSTFGSQSLFGLALGAVAAILLL
ncbi:hypothetical protein DPSP01_004677 [Paraphaeosphaeria sporulosa]|uniref:Cupredoxin n=1 Tax=Paraphaeosphaeria sporulosa TaxID=1460663 RepID=A0A177C8E2_9PLEO|nr:uncharacterized protein CC84DRAFT_1123676 [Paraphaeosphaeria sporulosa]OAG04014.1 hypothetical protein CC84DRAFT_1123676 [Paraphaeosphaeria sporulosa]